MYFSRIWIRASHRTDKKKHNASVSRSVHFLAYAFMLNMGQIRRGRRASSPLKLSCFRRASLPLRLLSFFISALISNSKCQHASVFVSRVIHWHNKHHFVDKSACAYQSSISCFPLIIYLNKCHTSASGYFSSISSGSMHFVSTWMRASHGADTKNQHGQHCHWTSSALLHLRWSAAASANMYLYSKTLETRTNHLQNQWLTLQAISSSQVSISFLPMWAPFKHVLHTSKNIFF